MGKLLNSIDIRDAYYKGLDTLSLELSDETKDRSLNELNKIIKWFNVALDNQHTYGLFEELDGCEFLELWEFAVEDLEFGCKTLQDTRNNIAYILAVIGMAYDDVYKRIEKHYFC